MKTSVRITACVMLLTVLAAAPSAMAQADKLIGVWKLTEVVTTGYFGIFEPKAYARTSTKPD
jgi:hypothetical protein